MKNTKKINALIAFELKNSEKVNGGRKEVRWVGADPDGEQICDIYNHDTGEWTCGSYDKGLRLGETW